MSILGLFDSGGLDIAYGGGGFDLGDYGDFGMGEFAGFPEFEFDQGGFSFPDFWSSPDFVGGEGYAQDLEGLQFNTATGEVVLPSGQPFDVGDTTLQTRGLLEGTPGAPPQAGPGFFQRVAQGAGGVMGGINKALEGSALARGLATGLVGAAGLGASRLIGGAEPRLRVPGYTEAPETMALRRAAFPGQLTIAGQLAERAAREAAAETEQAPMSRDVRMTSLARMGGFLPGGAEDPIVAGLRAEAIRALRPDYTDPLVEESIRLSEAELMNRLQRQYGGLESAQTSTPGIDTHARFAAQRGLARAGARREAIGAYAPAAISAESGIQNIRRQNLGDVERFSRFGIEGAPSTAVTLRTMAGSPEEANMVNFGLQREQALTAFNQATQGRRELAAGIGGIAGQVAGAVGQRPSRLEELLMRSGYY